MAKAGRDVAALRGALDDVDARHELRRTIVFRDAAPPYHLGRPPSRVPLEIRDLPPVAGKSRDLAAQELIVEALQDTMIPREVPILRALLCRFDDRDSVLFVTTHHSVSDLWSMQVLIRDLGAFYAARASGVPAKLPAVRQYREYSEWQKASAASQADDGAPQYWLDKLHGAREFALPTDRDHPENYSRPYSEHTHVVDADVIAAAADLATATRTSMFMVMLSALYVLAHQITGATDLAVRARSPPAVTSRSSTRPWACSLTWCPFVPTWAAVRASAMSSRARGKPASTPMRMSCRST